MIFLERLYLVLEVSTFVFYVNCPYVSTAPTVHSTIICQFPCNFSPEWPLIFALSVMFSPFPLPIPSPPILGPTIPRVLFPRSWPLGGNSPPSIMGARWWHLQLVRGSADSVCLRPHCYLLHAPPRPHTRPRTLTTPLHDTTLHSHLPLTNTPAPHNHLYFGYKLPVWHVLLGLKLVAAKDRATLHVHSRLGKIYKSALVVPPFSPHQRTFVCGACIGTAQVGVSLVSLFNPLFKQSRLHCLDVRLTYYLWYIKVWWQYLHQYWWHHPGTLPYLTWCVYLLCLLC